MNELLQQMLETERGDIQIYRTALKCAVNPDLKKEWTEYLERTERHERHERVAQDLFEKLGIEEGETPGRLVVKHIGD